MEQTVQKALNLLEALVRSNQPRRLTELSRQLGLTKPNGRDVSREMGFVEVASIRARVLAAEPA